jgi:glutamate synthase (NADPH/NADH) small chain
LLKDFDAVFLGMGTYKVREGRLPGETCRACTRRLPYLISNINRQLGMPEPPHL